MNFSYGVQGCLDNDDPNEDPTIFNITVNVWNEHNYTTMIQNTKTNEILQWEDFLSKYPRTSLLIDAAYCVQDSLEDYERFNRP